MLISNHLIGFGAFSDAAALSGSTANCPASTSSGTGAFNVRVVIDKSLFTSGSAVRLTFSGGGAATTIAGAAIGPKTGTFDMSAATRITFSGGSNSGSVSAYSATVASDIIPFSFTNSVDLVVGIYISTGGLGYHAGVTTGYTNWYNTTGADQSQSLSYSGSADAANTPYCLTKFEW